MLFMRRPRRHWALNREREREKERERKGEREGEREGERRRDGEGCQASNIVYNML